MSAVKIRAGSEVTIAVVAVRGVVKAPQQVGDTLAMLNLHRKNHCIIVGTTPAIKGMVHKVKDYVTWGEISDATFTELVQQRGEEYKGRQTDIKEKYQYKGILNVNGRKYKKYFRLNPPRKGFGRKGIKVQFAAGGALGYRGEKMNDLIRRML